MKCVFTFPVKWIVKVNGVQPFTHNGWNFDFVQENDLISKIIISVPMTELDKMPTLTPNPKNPQIIDFAINQPASTELLMKALRTLEGFLSVYGLEEIGLNEIDTAWLADTEEEKQKFGEQHLKLKHTGPKAPDTKIPFAVVKRSVMASTQALDWEVPLGFYRKGTNDHHDRKYIDAIHDFYFLLETLFGNGKTKNYQVLEEFKKSPSLVAFAAQVLKEGGQIIAGRGTRTIVLDEFKQKLSKKTPEQYLEHIVNLRGFLHHHSLGHKKIWNPTSEYEYEMDSILLSYFCFKICSTKVESMICTPVIN